jgi:hypothetical protein
MNSKEIIEMARRAGVRDDENIFEFSQYKYLEAFAKLVAAKEQDRCCSIVFAQCESDNVAQRTVDAIRGKA